MPRADDVIWGGNLRLRINKPCALHILRDQKVYLHLCSRLRQMWATSVYTNFEASNILNVDESLDPSSGEVRSCRVTSDLDGGRTCCGKARSPY